MVKFIFDLQRFAEISSSKESTLVSGTEGDDYIENTFDGVTITAIGGDDDIWNYGDNVSVDGGKDNDLIVNISNDSTLNGNEGQDVIYNFRIAYVDGERVDGGGENVSILGGLGNDTVYNYGSKVKIDGGTGDDVLVNYGESYVDDELITYGEDGRNVTMDGGLGNDYIYNFSSEVSINGGVGDDFIKNGDDAGDGGAHTTIVGGKGNDTILLDSDAINNLIQYKAGDGNDSIIGFNKTSTLKIGNGTTDTYSSVKSDNGSDIIVTVGEGKITLQGAATLSPVNILGTKKEDVLMDTNRINNKSLTGTAGNDEIFNYANTVTLAGGAGDDVLTTLRKTTGVKLYGEVGDDTLEAYNATKVLLSGGYGEDVIYSSGSANTINGGKGDDAIEIDSTKTLITYADGDGNDIVEGFNATSTLKIGNGTTDTYFAQKVDDDVIITVGDGSIKISNATKLWIETLNGGLGGLNNIKGTFQNDTKIFDNTADSSATLDPKIRVADASSRTSNNPIKITGNALANTISGGAGKDTLYGGDGNDSIVGGKGNDKIFGDNGDDTLWGGAGNDQLKGGNGEDLFIFSGGKDTITDYAAGEDMISLGAAISSTAVSGDDAIVKIGKNVLTIKNANHKTVSFIDDSGEEFDITFGKKILDNSSDSSYTADSGIDFVDASKRTTSIEITGNKLDNTILGGKGDDVIYGLGGTDSIFGGAGKDSLYGGDGDDTLDGGAGNDTLKGDKGDDIFVYSGGKDIIADYAPGEDKISLSSAYSDVAIKGRNVVLTVGSGTLTIKNAVYENITFINAAGVESTEVFGGEKLTNSSNSKVVLDPTVEFANATERTKTITITGNDLNNSILGGSGKDVIYGEDGNDSLLGNAGADSLYGGDGDDTLIGGLGDDRLWGDDGADTFIYKAGDGKDIIYNFDEDDILNLEGIEIDDIIVDSTGSSKGKLVLNFDDANSITLSKYVTNTFNINGTHYVYKGTKFTKDE